MYFLNKIKAYLLANMTSSILMAVSVILTGRLYSPSQFGDFGVFVSITTIASSVIFLRFEQCVLNHYKKYAMTISQLSVMIGLGLILTLLPLLIYLDALIIALCSFFICLNNLYIFFCTRHLKYTEGGWVGLCRVMTMIFIQIVSHEFYFNGLIFGYVLSYFLSTIPFIIRLSKKKPEKNKLIAMLKRNSEYCFYGLPQTVLNTSVNNLVPIFLNGVYGSTVTGYYTMAMRCIQLPHRIIVNAIRGIVTSTYSDRNKIQRKMFFYKSTFFLFIISLILFPVGVYFSGDIILFFLGGKWIPSSDIIAVLAIWMFFSFINVAAISYLSFTRNTKALLKMEVIFGFLKVISALVSWSCSVEYIVFITLFSIISALHSLYAIFYVHRRFCEALH